MTTVDRMFVGAGGIGIAAMVRGPADGPPVLLAHGGGQTHWAWRRTTEALAKRGFKAVAIDLRGHGESDWSPDGDYHYETFASDLIAVADQIGGSVAVVGASLGGVAGLIAEGELSPGHFSSLTLVDITARPDPKGVARITGFMSANLVDGFATLEEAADAIGAYTANRSQRGPSDSLRRYLRRGTDGRFRWHWDPRFLENVELARAEALDRVERATLALKLPVHLVRGGSSDLVSPDAAEAFKAQVPHARYTDIAGAGHMVVGDRNDVFSDAVINFLEAHHMA